MTRRDKILLIAFAITIFIVAGGTAVTLALQVRDLNGQLSADHHQSQAGRCEIITILTSRQPAAEAEKYRAQAGCRG